jgi:hypothetical protein
MFSDAAAAAAQELTHVLRCSSSSSSTGANTPLLMLQMQQQQRRMCPINRLMRPRADIKNSRVAAAACRSFFGCCPKTYSPYKTTFEEITPVGFCEWSVVPEPIVRTAAHLGVKMGSVTAKW